jgi:hypothetical protein
MELQHPGQPPRDQLDQDRTGRPGVLYLDNEAYNEIARRIDKKKEHGSPIRRGQSDYQREMENVGLRSL